MPEFAAKTMKQLGTPTADALALAQRALCSPVQLAAAIKREKERREAAGFSDAVQAVQPLRAPEPIDETNYPPGTQLEICWSYTSTVDNKTKVPMWCPCTIVRIADGNKDMGVNNKPLSDLCRTLAPRGMMLIKWDPDPDRGETDYPVCWYALDPRKWNKDSTHRAWRFHPEELAKRARAAREAPDTPCRC